MNSPTPPERLLKRSTSRPFTSVCSDVADACAAHQFGVIGMIDLKAKMNAKGVAFERECSVFEVCNPHKAHGVLSVNMDIASALPCRLAIYTEEDRTVLSTMKPTLLLDLYDAPGAEAEALEVEHTMQAIIDRLCANAPA